MAGKWNASITGASALTQSFQAMRMKLDGPVTYTVGTPVQYSVHVELGTSRRQAQPYLRPAVEQAARNLQEIFKNAQSLSDAIATLALQIEEQAKRLAPVDTGNLRASIAAERVK